MRIVKFFLIFLMLNFVIYGEIKGYISEKVFITDAQEGKIRTLVENIEAAKTIDIMIKNGEIESWDVGGFLVKKKRILQFFEKNFDEYYNQEIITQILERNVEKKGFEIESIRFLANKGKESIEKLDEFTEITKDCNFDFYVNYFDEYKSKKKIVKGEEKVTEKITPKKKTSLKISGIKAKPIKIAVSEKWGGELKNREICLTFDDGPTKNSELIMEGLKNADVKATFFVLGMNIKGQKARQEILRKEIEEGHEVGVHSMNHLKMVKLDDKKLKIEVVDSMKLIENIIGERPEFFRTPYGARDKKTMSAVSKNYTANIMWSIDSCDWHKNMTPEMIKNRVEKLAFFNNGGIILFHDINPKTASIIESVVLNLKNSGFEFKKINEIYGKKSESVSDK